MNSVVKKTVFKKEKNNLKNFLTKGFRECKIVRVDSREKTKNLDN